MGDYYLELEGGGFRKVHPGCFQGKGELDGVVKVNGDVRIHRDISEFFPNCNAYIGQFVHRDRLRLQLVLSQPCFICGKV